MSFKWLSKLRAKLLIKDEIQSLQFLSHELSEGRVSEEDLQFWDAALEQMSEYLEYAPEHKDSYKKFLAQRNLVGHSVRVKKLENYTGGIIVTSSIYGLFDTLVEQRKKHQRKNDVVVVTGNWMGFEGDVKSIRKAMDLSEEGVIFLKGRIEEKYLESDVPEDDLETLFVKSLPRDVQTPYTIITTGNSMNEPVPMIDFMKNKVPNLTGKTFIGVHPTEGKGTIHLNEKDIILVAPGDAIRLDISDKQ